MREVSPPSYQQIRIPSAFLIELTETLALLTEAGLETSEALELSAEIFADHRRGDLVNKLRSAVTGGEPLSQVLSSAGVPGIYSSLVSIGEGLGGLSTVLPALWDYLKTRKMIGEKLISALIYPLFILTVLISGAVLILTLIAPRLIAALESLSTGNAGVDATVARMELAVGGLGILTIMILGLPLFGTLAYRLVPHFQFTADRILLLLPGLGSFLLAGEMMNLCFALEALTQGGVLLEQAVKEASSVLSNSALRRDVESAGGMLLFGASPPAAFAAGGRIPRRFIRWLAIGERTGSPAEVFAGLKHYYRHEYEKRLKRITGLIEPVLILITGGILFAAVLIFVLPLFRWYGELL